MHVDEVTEPPACSPDLAEDVILWIISNEGWKVNESFPATAIQRRFESLKFAGMTFAGVINALIAKGLLGGEGKFLHLTSSGQSRAQR